MNWMLIVIDSEGVIEHVATDDLDSILHEQGPIFYSVAGEDPDITKLVIEDLSRRGARYSEFVGGTVVLASVEA